jgi:hypothetical protein
VRIGNGGVIGMTVLANSSGHPREASGASHETAVISP